MAKLRRISVPRAVWEISGWSWIPTGDTRQLLKRSPYKTGRRQRGQTEDGLGLMGDAGELGVLRAGNRNEPLGQPNEFVEVAHEDFRDMKIRIMPPNG
jgi:hypothetical protein